jgi:hypothetical protein
MRRGRHVADIQVNLCPSTTARRRATTSPSACRPRWRPSPKRSSARAWPWPRCRRAPRCCRRSWRRSTARPRNARRWRAQRSAIASSRTPRRRGRRLVRRGDQPKARFVIDKEKAALNGISAETISQTLRIAVGGQSVDLLHVPREKEDVNIVLELPRSMRTRPEELLALRVRSGDANALPEPGGRAAAGSVARTGALERTITTRASITRTSCR